MVVEPVGINSGATSGSHDGTGRCSVCGRSSLRLTPLCFCCRLVAGQLGLPLASLVALCEYRVGDRTHRRLRCYKDAPVAELREQCRAELIDELAEWSRRGGAEWLMRGGDSAVITVVPSSCRPGIAPAEQLVDGVPLLAARHLRLLARGSATAGHLRARRDAFALAPGVDRPGLAGLSVLVFDDTTTTGAAAQSAAAVLRLAGAQVTGVLVMGRALAPEDR